MRKENKYIPQNRRISKQNLTVTLSKKSLKEIDDIIETGKFDKRIAVFTVILALGSAIFSAVGAIATWGQADAARDQTRLAQQQTDYARKQTEYALEQLTMAKQNVNIAQVNASYEGYISSLTELCGSIDATNGKVIVETSYDDRGFQIVARLAANNELANKTSFVPFTPEYYTTLKRSALTFENAMILTNIWAVQEKSIPLQEIGHNLLNSLDKNIGRNNISQSMLIKYGFCRHMVSTAEALIGNKKLVSDTDLMPLLLPENDPQKELRTDIDPHNYSLYNED